MAVLDVTLTMAPCPCLRMCGMMARQVANTPKLFVSKISRMMVSGVAPTTEAMPIPALFTSTSMVPNAATPSSIGRLMLGTSPGLFARSRRNA